MPEQQAFGDWLRLRRKALDLSRESLADRVGCSAATIRKVEAGERRPSVQIAELLAAAFNIPPGERPAFVKYARGDLRSAVGQSTEETPWRAPSSHRSNLPFPATSLIGREQEVADIRAYLMKADIRLVTLTGPPGIGKTRLSLESAHGVADHFSEAVFFVPLAALDGPSLVARAIIQSLGYVEAMDHAALEQLISGIGDKQMLLVLDNFEHLMEGAAPLVSALLSACPRLKILVTSREALRVSGEWVYSVPALPMPGEISSISMETASRSPALMLFAERARAVRSDFALTASNVQMVASICRRLDGLPLAIELIAARIRLMSPQALLDQLSDQFVLSADGMRADSVRQKTLQHAIGWSYALLSPEERRLFAYLSVFAGGFTLEAVESIFSQDFTGKPVRGLVASLLDKSLVQRTSDERRGGRYDMLVTIRQYAIEKLEAAGEMILIRDRHLTYFIELAEQSEPHIWGSDVASWGKRLDVELDNFRAAMDWAMETGKAAGALRMTGSLVYYWLVHGDLLAEWHSRIQRALSSPGGREPTLERAEALNTIGFFSWADLYLLDKRPELEEALRIGQEIGDQWTVACALRNLGLNATMRGSYVEARTLLEESLEIWRAMRAEPKVRIGTSLTLLYLGDVAIHEEEPAFARSLLEECVQILRKQGEKNYLAYAVRRLALLAAQQGNYQEAAALTTESLGLNSEIGDTRGVVASLVGFGGIATARGSYERAARLMAAAGFHLNATGVQLLNVDKMAYEANLALVQRELDEETLAKCWAEGHTMNPEQAIQYALEG